MGSGAQYTALARMRLGVSEWLLLGASRMSGAHICTAYVVSERRRFINSHHTNTRCVGGRDDAGRTKRGDWGVRCEKTLYQYLQEGSSRQELVAVH